MPKRAREMTAAEVRQLNRPGLHAVGGCSGLVLQVNKNGSKSWLLRAMIGGQRRSIGLGPYPDTSLKRARQKAAEYREAIREGRDPLEERKAAQRALAEARASRISFDEAARRYIANKRHEFSNPKHASQWERTLAQYASPVIGNKPVADVSLNDVVEILQPIWTTRTETASRLRGRIENVIAWAITSGYRSADNPARWKGHLDTVLPKPSKVSKVQHHRALPIDQVGQFMAKLRERQSMAARALEFIVLTATRSGEVRGATWDEIDLDAGVWTIPADRMKSNREHRVPLSRDALALLRALPRFAESPYVFPNSKGGPLTDVAVSKIVKSSGFDTTVHGLRSTFRDWAAERTSYPNEVIEAALAHTISDKVERAYRRGDLFDKRRRLMGEWAQFCVQPEPQAGGTVTAIREAQ